MENEISVEQEIEWLKEEIDQDECIRGSDSFSDFHEQRIAENREKLKEFEDIIEAQNGVN